MRTVLVTGASGFIGRHLIPMLTARGYRVIATSRQRRSDAALDKAVESQNSVHWRQVSGKLDANRWPDLLQGVDFIIHLAARVHVMDESTRTMLPAYLESNTELTKHIAFIAKEQGAKRFVFVSTIKVLGEKTLEEPFDVSSSENPNDPYSESKHFAESALRDICTTGNMEFVIVRPTLVIGDGASGNLDRLLKWIASGIPIPLGGIPNRRSLVSIETLCQILIRSLENPMVANKTILAADPESLSTPDIVQALARGYGQPIRLFSVPQFIIGLLQRAPVIGKSVSRLSESLVVDSSDTFENLGWRPDVSIRDRLEAVGKRFRDRAQAYKVI